MYRVAFLLTLTQRISVVTVRPSQSLMLNIKKQHTEIKNRSVEEKTRGDLVTGLRHLREEGVCIHK